MLMDILPTCLSCAGVEPPAVDGRDQRRSMEDGGHQYVLSECEGMAIISDGRYKYIQRAQSGRSVCEAYDLVNDPHEFDDFVDDPANALDVGRLRGALAGMFMKDFLK